MELSIEKTFPAELEWLHAMLAAIHGFVSALEFPEGGTFSSIKLGRVELGAEEALVNIIRHAFKVSTGPRLISIACARLDTPPGVSVVIKDAGTPFDPIQEVHKKDPDRIFNLDEEGGFGIHVMHHSIDDIDYRREGGCNVLTLIFYV